MAPQRLLRPIGDFECAVLLAVMRLGENAYGVAVQRELEHRLKRSVSFGAVYTTLNRLIDKDMVSAHLGDPTPERGGRAKKFFAVQPLGVKALQVTRRASDAMWAMRPASRRR
jgi:DNA-binding PadR family transcriptional regulator